MDATLKYFLKRIGIFLGLKITINAAVRHLIRTAAKAKAEELGYDSIEEALKDMYWQRQNPLINK